MKNWRINLALLIADAYFWDCSSDEEDYDAIILIEIPYRYYEYHDYSFNQKLGIKLLKYLNKKGYIRDLLIVSHYGHYKVKFNYPI